MYEENAKQAGLAINQTPRLVANRSGNFGPSPVDQSNIQETMCLLDRVRMLEVEIKETRMEIERMRHEHESRIIQLELMVRG